VAYSDDEENFLFSPERWDVLIEGECCDEFEIKKYSNIDDNVNNQFRFAASFDKTTFIYYTFNLDFKADTAGWRGFKDLSTACLLCKPRKDTIENLIKKDDADKILRNTSDLDLFIGTEISRSLDLIFFGNKEILPFTPPEELYLSITHQNKYILDEKKDRNIITIIGILEHSNRVWPPNIQTKNNFYISLFVNTLLSSYGQLTFSSLESPPEKDLNIKKYVLAFFKRIKDVKMEVDDGQWYPISLFEKLNKSVPELIDCFEDYFEQGLFYLSKQLNDSYAFMFKLNENSSANFRKFYALYLDGLASNSFLHFSWRTLSTGQQSFLSFASRFHYEKNVAIGHDDLKDVVILIDEGDSGFHPEWQKEFFNSSLNFLAKLFEGHNAQIIYTANAPYIVSDLTKNHITFIDKKGDDLIIYDKDNDKEHTFGQNIHTLLSDSFFMNEGLIGDFAKNKINKIIEYCERVENSHNREMLLAEYYTNNYRKIQQQIGEPYLKEIIGNHLKEAEKQLGIKKDGLENELNLLAQKYGVENIKKSISRL
jgi:hypothetical protein